jgi:hypothetical protein
MIYIIDNGGDYSEHVIFFVEAPADFGAWFRDVLTPNIPLMRHIGIHVTYPNCYIVGCTDSVSWWEGGSQEVAKWLEHQFRTWVGRPKYRLEEQVSHEQV